MGNLSSGSLILNRYRVDDFIGKGGMADVYKVWDGQRATFLAMKVLHDDLAEDKVFLRRFKREAFTLSKLQHPSIVRFYGLEQTDDLSFMLMDYIEGTTLRKEIYQAQSALTLERVLEIMRPVCSALHYAHAQGITHCDIKPANIMLHKNGSVLLSDFGIARMTEASTSTLIGAGTPAYMAPEQARGEDPTPQTDIYALGIVLYEMLTGGERPFTGENARSTGSTSEKIRWEQINTQPFAPRRLNPNIPLAVEATVLKCLRKEPAQRYPGAQDVFNALAQAARSARPSVQPVPKVSPVIVVPIESLPDETVIPVENNTIPPGAPPHVDILRQPPVTPVQRNNPLSNQPARVGRLPDSPMQPVRRDNPLTSQPARIDSISRKRNFTIFIMGVVLLVLVLFFAAIGHPVGVTSNPTATQMPTQTITATPYPLEMTDEKGVKMRLISAGEFGMGGNANDALIECQKFNNNCNRIPFLVEEPLHKVLLGAFYMDLYEVTNARYADCVSAGICAVPAQTSSLLYASYYGSEKYADYPVIYVDWKMAKTYCEWRSPSTGFGKTHLPSEAEWEKAARGKDDNIYPWGAQFEGESANSCDKNCPLDPKNTQYDDGNADAASIGSYPNGKSLYGLYDLAGNVSEWTADWYDAYPNGNSSASNDFGQKYRVVRGGSWADSQFYLSALFRDAKSPDSGYHNVGFRCVQTMTFP